MNKIPNSILDSINAKLETLDAYLHMHKKEYVKQLKFTEETFQIIEKTEAEIKELEEFLDQNS